MTDDRDYAGWESEDMRAARHDRLDDDDAREQIRRDETAAHTPGLDSMKPPNRAEWAAEAVLWGVNPADFPDTVDLRDAVLKVARASVVRP